MRLMTLLLPAFVAFSAQGSDIDTKKMTSDMKVCEETAALMTAAYTLHPVDAQARVDFINSEKDRIVRDALELRIEDRHLIPAMGAVTFHLVELDALNSADPLSRETQIRLAARAGAACGLRSGIEGAP